jgi:predicted SAM-dependent methyltransferase
MIERNDCINCNFKLKHFFVQEKFPIKFCVVNEFTNIKKTLSFSICEKCNIIQLDKLVKLDELYDIGHNYDIIGNTWKKFFNFFNDIINKYIINANILEIGCPSGKIAMLNRGFKNWYIVDPNVKKIDNKDVHSINTFFDEKFKINKQIDLIIHSHLFEHIYNPHDFLKNCHIILKDNGKMIFAIPNMEHNLDYNIAPYGGVMFEHNIFYSKKTIVEMLEKNNFEILNIYDFENHSIIFETKKVMKLKNFLKIENNINYLSKFYKNIEYYDKFINNCSTICLCESNKEKKIYLFGASYNTQILLYMGLHKLNVVGILDNCIQKQNKYLYGYNIKIYSPKILIDNNCIVILKNGYYSDEIKKQIILLNKNIIIIN